MDNKTLYLLFTAGLLLQCAADELYTATTDLRGLVKVEEILLPTLEQYIKEETEKLESLNRFYKIFKTEQTKALEDTDLYISNPINAYLLIKRLTVDWKEVESLMHMNIGQGYLRTIARYREYLKFPSDEDLTGAAVALARLTDTYDLQVSDLVQGKINNVQYGSKLTASDCYYLGIQNFMKGDMEKSYIWLKEAESSLYTEVNKTLKKAKLLELYVVTEYKRGNMLHAQTLNNELLQIEPHHEMALLNVKAIEEGLKHLEDNKDKNEMEYKEEMPHLDADERRVRKLYKQLCRGESLNSITLTSRLKCSYQNLNNPFLIIAPFKIEEVFDDPQVAIFHDIISDKEIEVVKQLAQPIFKRATVIMPDGQKPADYRISKSAFLVESEFPEADLLAVNRRANDMAGLVGKSGEPLQVVNYGIGGQYTPHFDFARKAELQSFRDSRTGNRITTVLVYMSDVLQGGATVFPNINLAVWPKKGTAVVWNNLHSSGDGNPKTLHAGCPVVVGSKWVCNKWYHEVGNEFLRPCNLTKPPLEDTI